MENIPPKTCSRCGDEFAPEQHFQELITVDRPYVEDVQLGNFGNTESKALCPSCVREFHLWLDPEVDTLEELRAKGWDEVKQSLFEEQS